MFKVAQAAFHRLYEWRQKNTEAKLMKKIVHCFRETDLGRIQSEMNYIRALAVKAYYENRLRYDGYERVETALRVMQGTMHRTIRKDRITGTTLMIRQM